MMTENDVVKSDIPSHFADLLRSLAGHRIVGVTRYSWWGPEEVEEESGVTGKDVFSLTSGPAEIAFDTGLSIGVSSNPSTNSVSIWIEKVETGQLVRNEPLASDDELHPISATDPVFSDDFWRRVVGARVVEISILVRQPATARLAELPNEVGLCFTLDSGDKVVAAHGLHDDSDDFSIIPDRLILDGIRPELLECPLAAKGSLC